MTCVLFVTVNTHTSTRQFAASAITGTPLVREARVQNTPASSRMPITEAFKFDKLLSAWK